MIRSLSTADTLSHLLFTVPLRRWLAVGGGGGGGVGRGAACVAFEHASWVRLTPPAAYYNHDRTD